MTNTIAIVTSNHPKNTKTVMIYDFDGRQPLLDLQEHLIEIAPSMSESEIAEVKRNLGLSRKFYSSADRKMNKLANIIGLIHDSTDNEVRLSTDDFKADQNSTDFLRSMIDDSDDVFVLDLVDETVSIIDGVDEGSMHDTDGVLTNIREYLLR